MIASLRAVHVHRDLMKVLCDATRAMKEHDAKKGDAWFAERLNTSRETFNRYLNGNANPDAPFLCRWAVLVGVDIKAKIITINPEPKQQAICPQVDGGVLQSDLVAE